MSVSQVSENNEPRPLETTGALVFGWPAKGLLQYKVELASHERAAVVQRLAESGWPSNLSLFYGVSVRTKAVERLSSSACRVIADSATALKHALIKPVYGSVAHTTVSISKLSKDEKAMPNGKRLVVNTKRRKK